MASYSNIEEYRKIKKKKSFIKKLIMLLILAVIAAVAFILINVFKGKDIFGNGDSLFPITVKKEQVTDITIVSDNLAALTKSNLIIYNSNGERISSYIHGFTNPILKKSNKYLLTYDRGGKGIRVDTDKRNIGKIDMSKNILTAQIASDGTVAVVTLSDRYSCEVTVYNSTLTKQFYRYYSNTGISSIVFSKDAQKLLCSSVVSQDGNLSAKIDILNLKDENDINEFIVSDVLPLDVSYCTNNSVKIISKDSIVIYDFKSKDKKEYNYKGTLQHFDLGIDGATVLVNKSFESNLYNIVVIDQSGKETAIKSIDDEIVDISCDNNRIEVLCKGIIYNLDTSLNVISSTDLLNAMSKIASDGKSLYILGTDIIDKNNIS